MATYNLITDEIEKIVHLVRHSGEPKLLLFFETILTDNRIVFDTRVECVEYFRSLAEHRNDNAIYILKKIAKSSNTDIKLLPVIVRTLMIIDPENCSLSNLLDIIPADRRESVRIEVFLK